MDREALEEQGGPAPAVQRELEESADPHASAQWALDARGPAQEAVDARRAAASSQPPAAAPYASSA